jgi:hypothetical protein
MTQYVAKPFVAGTPEALVLGQTVAAFSSNLQAEEIAHLLPKYGFDQIDPEKWYPHQNWMNLLQEISQITDGETSLVAFGKEVVRTAAMPPELDSIPKVLDALHAIHHINLRNIPEEEGYKIEHLGEGHALVYHNTPNPDTAIYGFLWGLAARFKAPNETFTVVQVPNPKPDEIPGTVFEVKWGKA